MATKEQLIDRYRDINVEHDWWNCTIEQFEDMCKGLGLRLDSRTHTYTKKGADGKVKRDQNGNIEQGSWSEPMVYFNLGYGGTYCVAHFLNFTLTGVLDAYWKLHKSENDKWMLEPKEGYVKALVDFGRWVEKEFGVVTLNGGMHSIVDGTAFHVEVGDSYIRDVYAESDYISDELEGHELALFNQLIECTVDDVKSHLENILSKLADELESEYEDLTSDDAVWDTIVANELDETDEGEEDGN